MVEILDPTWRRPRGFRQCRAPSWLCSLNHDLWYFKPKKYSNSLIVVFKHPWSCTILLVLTLLYSYLVTWFKYLIYFHWWKLLDEISIFSYNIETFKVPSDLILLETFGKLYIFNKMWFQEVYVMKMKISNFLKTPFFSITLTVIDDYECWWYQRVLKFWPLLVFVGLHGLFSLCDLGWIFYAKSGIFW